MGIPNVLVAYHSRPMCAGLFFREAFRQAGCNVIVAGPNSPQVYGIGDNSGREHTFDACDFVPTDVDIPNAPVLVTDALNALEGAGKPHPDLIVMVDQYDPYFLYGETDGIPMAVITVENWGDEYARRATMQQTTFRYWMIAHSQTVPFPSGEEVEWMPFGFDPNIHPYWPHVERDKSVVQIGTAYEPRPQVWNYIRGQMDGAGAWTANEYLAGCAESARTLFGRIPSYRGLALAHNRAKVALSSSNCDFSPMRTCEAYAMGCVLASDDVPAIRGVLGPPLSEGGFWISHDRTPEGHLRAVEQAVEVYDDLIGRGLAHVYRHHLYRERADRILRRAGLNGALRVV